MLLSTTLAATAVGDGLTSLPEANDTKVAAKSSVAIHRIALHPTRIDVDVEEIRGVLVADGSLPGAIELLLTGTRISPELGRTVATHNALVPAITFTRSAWGREDEAQITLAVADGVSATTVAGEGTYDVILTARYQPESSFIIRFHETPYRTVAVRTSTSLEQIKQNLQGLASQPDTTGVLSWWNDSTPARPASNRVTSASLAAVRDAEVELPVFDAALFAAQNEEATGGDGDGDAAADAPSVEDAEPAPVEESPEPPVKRMPKAPNTVEANKELTRQMIAEQTRLAPEMPEVAPKRAWHGSPLQQPVTIDFRDMDLLNVVQILADMAGINVVAGADLAGPVTLNLRDVPLMQAMETALRLNGLGIVEEQGIYHIKPYLDAIASQRTTEVVDLEHADAEEIVTTLKSVIQGSE